MQKKKQTQTKPIKQIIILIIAVILLLLLIFAEDIIKLINKNKLNLAENTENEVINNEPNPPQLSAGMTPVKWNGSNWIITTSKDKDWYDYSKGKPAYIMLNDGKYQSELIRNMTNKELAENNVGVGVPDDPNIRGTIFMWIPRFAYKTNEDNKIEIGYIKGETEPGGNWTVLDTFSYTVADETKPNYSLSGVWIEKGVDTAYATKVAQMNQEESVYGFIANTKASQVVGVDMAAMFYTSDLEVCVNPMLEIDDVWNTNRIILKVINTNKVEPIKAKITHNTQDQKIEIQVTYTSNGIREIIDDYGKPMTLTEENGVIYTDTGSVVLGKGTYSFTVVDNKGNKRELSITPTINSLFKVAYINGTDNMDNTATNAKTQETITADENALGDQLIAKYPSINYWRAITDSNNAITAIGAEKRTEEDKQLYIWGKYKANIETKYDWKGQSVTSNALSKNRKYCTYGAVTKNNYAKLSGASMRYYYNIVGSYTTSNSIPVNLTTDPKEYLTYYVHWESYSSDSNGNAVFTGTEYHRTSTTEYSRGDFMSDIIAEDGTYTIGSSTSVHSDGYWYEKGILAPKYTLYKYDSSLTLQSTYDVDTKTLTTIPIDISNKGNNKVKLTLNATGTDYKTYISSDNTNWQEVTEITSNTLKELNVDGWDKLYIKIETNTSIINNIDVAFYKD